MKCDLCHGWGRFDCMCDEQGQHIHSCGACAEGKRLQALEDERRARAVIKNLETLASYSTLGGLPCRKS